MKYITNYINQSEGFTLVELIVVVTILAILATIWFISIRGYSSSARDATRLTDINNIMKSLDVYQEARGNYPTPDGAFTVMYTGAPVWTQGQFGSGVVTKLSGQGLSKAPIDPLTGAYYIYSALSTINRYQIQADSDITSLAIIKWNYGGLTAKAQAGATVYALALPSIVTTAGVLGGPSLEISTDTLSNTLLINGSPSRVGVNFNPNFVVFSGPTLPVNDMTWGISNLVSSLKAAYAGSALTNQATIGSLLATSTGEAPLFGTAVIKYHLGGSIPMSTVAAFVPSALCAIDSGTVDTCTIQ